MSLIYPTNNSPNESPGRARNALGRSACALVVAGALVLPLTPAGAVTDPGAGPGRGVVGERRDHLAV